LRFCPFTRYSAFPRALALCWSEKAGNLSTVDRLMLLLSALGA
jgi:hypothetical protein